MTERPPPDPLDGQRTQSIGTFIPLFASAVLGGMVMAVVFILHGPAWAAAGFGAVVWTILPLLIVVAYDLDRLGERPDD